MVTTKTMEGKSTDLKDVFFLDKWEGKMISGCYFRSDIGMKIEAFEKECGKKVVGIGLDREGWNIEFFLEEAPNGKG